MDFSIKRYFSAFRFRWNDKFSFDGESHNYWEIVYIDKGSVISTEEEKIYLLEENQMLFHAPMEFHRIGSAPDSYPKGRIISFEAEGELPSQIKEGVFTLTAEEREDYIYTFKKVHRAFKNPENELDFLEAEARLKAFIIRISKTASRPKTYNSNSAKIYGKITSYMARNVTKNLSVEQIAKENFVSVSYVKYLFAKYAGISPKMHLNHLQIKKANELMDNGVTILEVSRTMNFSSPNYFSSFYKKQTGIPPSKYANR